MAQEQGRVTLTTRRTSTTYNFVREPNSVEDDEDNDNDDGVPDDDDDDDDFSCWHCATHNPLDTRTFSQSLSLLLDFLFPHSSTFVSYSFLLPWADN